MSDEMERLPTIGELLQEIKELRNRIEALESRSNKTGVVSKHAPGYVQEFITKAHEKAGGR